MKIEECNASHFVKMTGFNEEDELKSIMELMEARAKTTDPGVNKFRIDLLKSDVKITRDMRSRLESKGFRVADAAVGAEPKWQISWD